MTQKRSSSILITGATGAIGTALCKALSAKGVPFRAMVRSAGSAAAIATLEGAEIVTGDFSDTGSLALALRGIDKAFLLSNSSADAEALQTGFVSVGQQAGVRHIVKLSQLKADAQSPVRFLRYHARVEQAIRQSGMAFTFLRPNLFMQGLLGFRQSILHQGQFFATAGDARVSLVDIRDIAEVAAAALTEEGHEGRTHDLTGPEAYTHAELAAHLSTYLGRAIQYVDVSAEALLQGLHQAGFPAWQAEGLVEDYAHYARGEAAGISADIQTVTGHQPRGFTTFLHDFGHLFKV